MHLDTGQSPSGTNRCLLRNQPNFSFRLMYAGLANETAILSNVNLLIVWGYILLANIQSALPLFSQIPTIRHPNSASKIFVTQSPAYRCHERLVHQRDDFAKRRVTHIFREPLF
jgi:hypothetical protein